jgi:hypothetical protein
MESPRKGPAMTDAYRDDMAYIHDAEFGSFALAAAPVLVETLRHAGLMDGLVRVRVLRAYGTLRFGRGTSVCWHASRRLRGYLIDAS